MDLVESIIQFFKKPKKETVGKSPEGTCPVCWGYQEYDTKIRQMFKDKQIDVNNHQDRNVLHVDITKRRMPRLTYLNPNSLGYVVE